MNERVGGAFLLQAMKPTELLGSVACLLTGPRRGWIFAAVGTSSAEFSLSTSNGLHKLDMSRDVALRFASFLQVIVAQSRIAIGEVELVDDRADGHVRVAVDRDRAICTWPTSSAWFVHEPYDDEQVNIKIHPVVAAELATSIQHGIADFAPR